MSMMIDFATKKAFKKAWFFLIIGIIFLFIVFPVYLHLSAVDDLDTLSPYPCFKATDQDDLVATLEHKEKILIPTFVVKQHLEVNPLFERIPDFSLYVFTKCSRPLFLRC
jgi:hypothetical protein